MLIRRRQILWPGLREKRANASTLAALLRDAMFPLIVKARHDARVAGASRLAESFGVAAGAVGSIELTDRLRDVKRAEQYSRSLQKLAADKIGQADVIKAIDNRLTTIAITENASAFNEQRRKAADEIAARYHVKLIEIWDATLDKQTCDVCMSMDGKESIGGAGFPDGLVPGLVHPRCRCTSHFEVIH